MSRSIAPIIMRRRISLSAYISLLLALTAITPLLVTMSSIVIFLRPALISQISTDMERNARTSVQLIDTYFAERLNDIKTLSESAPIKSLLAGDQNSKSIVSDILFTSLHRDVANYISFSLLNPGGGVVLSYPSAPLPHGKYLITPEALQHLQQSDQVFISDVFYDPVSNTPSVDLYARVVSPTFQPLGFVRVSLGLHRLWEPVDSVPQLNGADSYAFVLDQHGVRIAYTNPDHSGFTHPHYLFMAVAPLTADFQKQIRTENLYGNAITSVADIDDPALATIQSGSQSSRISQFEPAGQNQTFEVASYTSTVAPWTYFVLRPLDAVTGLADQQLLSIVLIATLVLLLVIVIGVQIGRRMGLPIMRSVALLRKNSLSLKTLADGERVIATEQSWMVEASHVSLQSIKYYTNAVTVATQHLSAVSTELIQRSDNLSTASLYNALREIGEATAYIEEATKRQNSANEKLTTALHVTTQAAEQLTNGATSTDAAAAQLEAIVRQLTAIVGERNADTQAEPK